MSKTWTRRRIAPYINCGPCRRQLHTTRANALDAAASNEHESDTRFRIVRCPHGPGYHLAPIASQP